MAEKNASRNARGAASSKKAGANGTGKKTTSAGSAGRKTAGTGRGRSAGSRSSGSGSASSRATGTRQRSGSGTRQTKSQQTRAQQEKALTKTAAEQMQRSRKASNGYTLAWEIATWVVIAVSILFFISMIGFGGALGKVVSAVSFGLFGVMAYIFPFALLLIASFFISNHVSLVARVKTLGWVILFVTLCGIMQLILVGYNDSYTPMECYEAGALYRTGGGLIGGSLTIFFGTGIGVVGTWIVYFMLIIISLILITQKSLFRGMKRGSVRIAGAAIHQKNRSVMAVKKFLRAREDALLEMGDSDTLYDPQTDPRSGEDGSGADSLGEGFSILPREKRLERKARGVISDIRLSPEIMDSSQMADGDAAGAETSQAENTTDVFADDFQIRGLPGSLSGTAKSAEASGGMGAVASSVGVTGKGMAVSSDALSRKETGSAAAAGAGVSFMQEPAGNRERGQAGSQGRVKAKAPVDIFRSDKDNTVTTSAGKVAGTSPAMAVDPSQFSGKELREAAGKADEMIARRAGAGAGTSGAGTAGAGSAGTGTAGKGSTGTGAVVSGADAGALPDGIGSRKKRSSDQEIVEGINRVAGEIAQNAVEVKREYIFPETDLLSVPGPASGGTTEQELRETAAKLAQVFKTFGVNVKITDVTCGPSVTRYELMPEMGVKVSKIVSLQDDIQLNLAVTDIRIEAPIPCKAAVGIEVPNRKPTGVLLRELLESEAFRKAKSNLTYAVGKDIGGNIIVADIARMPHLLIAGSTGSGKSVFINTLIMSILYKAKPEDVKLIMIDPKVVELSVYNGIPHLFIPVVTDPKKAAGALNWAVAEMMARYQKFADAGVRDLKGYNARAEQVRAEMEKEAERAAAEAAKAAVLRAAQEVADGEDGAEMIPEPPKPPAPMPEKMPQIVIIVDELADLMMVASSEVEDAICRLAQLARAAGIHLVIATQRPSVDVITGLIKANMPSRIAFAVSSGVDSRTILDQVGAEKLLGNGDMFFSPQTYKQPLRVQGAYVSDKEVAGVVEFLKEQTDGEATEQKMAERMEEVAKSASASASAAGGGGDTDELFEAAARFIIEKDKASIGMLQRWFKIGFNRAARIMDQLSEAGVVGPDEGTKPRKVEMSMEQFENYLEQGG